MINLLGIILPFIFKLINMFFAAQEAKTEQEKEIKSSWDSFFQAYNKNVKSSADLSEDVDKQMEQLNAPNRKN